MKKMLFLFIITMFSFSCSTIKDPWFIEILNNAEHDVKVDSVKHFTVGLPFIPPLRENNVDDKKRYEKFLLKKEKIKCIYSTYGLYEYNLGCVIDKQTNELTKKYNTITQGYLEKRNGNDWEQKMNKQIDSILNQ